MWVRAYEEADCAATADVFFRGVHEGAARAYSAEQRKAWAPDRPDPAKWAARIDGQTAFVAERDGAVVGFMTLRHDGYLDFAYVLPDEMGKGTASALYAMTLNYARTCGLTELSTEASHLAKSFFTKHGWDTHAQQTVERCGVALTNFRMSHRLC